MWAKNGKYLISFRAFEGNMSKWSLNGWKVLNYIFLDQNIPSVIKFQWKIGKKCILRPFSDRFLNFEPLPPHILGTIGFL